MGTVKTVKVQSTFEKLSAVNVNKYVEKKNNLTYLSWAYAWGETKKVCPDATYKMNEKKLIKRDWSVWCYNVSFWYPKSYIIYYKNSTHYS